MSATLQSLLSSGSFQHGQQQLHLASPAAAVYDAMLSGTALQWGSVFMLC